MQIIDADGHLNERPYLEKIAKYMPKGNQATQLFPSLDPFHSPLYFLRKGEPKITTGNLRSGAS